ncbi:AAA-like domain protein [compost metagenome]
MGLINKVKNYYREVVDVYDDLQFSKMVSYSSKECRKVQKYGDKMTIDFVGSYDGDNISFYYLIQALPRTLDVNFKSLLRRECKNGVRATFLNNLRGHTIDWNSAQMNSRLRILRQVGEETNSAHIDAYNYHENIGAVSRQQWIEESLQYLGDADKRRGRALVKSSMLLIVSGVRGDYFDESIKSIERVSANMGLDLHRVLYDIPELIKYFSPFSKRYTKNMANLVPTQVLTDEIVARYSTYDQGILGVDGLYFGTDIYSKFPVLKRVKQTTETAENWLITAETGGGKSFAVKVLILQLLAFNYNGTIMDIEGFEYIPLANFLSHRSNVKILNMAEGQGAYFDPVQIATPIGDEDIDRDLKNMSYNFTLAKYKVLLGATYANDEWVRILVDDAIAHVYAGAGVTDDMVTWSNSEGLSLKDIYTMMFTLKKNKFRVAEEYDKAVEKATAVLSKYFESYGSRSGYFKNRVNVKDIVDTDLLICSFGMAGKSPASIDEVNLALMQLDAAQLSHQRSIFSKSKGKFNFKLWEEFQRWGKFPDSEKTIGVALTGGRKLGDVNIIVTNVVKELLDEDRFGLFSNITSYLVGAIGDDKVRKDLCDRLSIPEMKQELDEIAEAARIEEDRKDSNVKAQPSPFSKAFLCGLDRTKYAIVKMDVREKLAKSALFRTGVDIGG